MKMFYEIRKCCYCSNPNLKRIKHHFLPKYTFLLFRGWETLSELCANQENPGELRLIESKFINYSQCQLFFQAFHHKFYR